MIRVLKRDLWIDFIKLFAVTSVKPKYIYTPPLINRFVSLHVHRNLFQTVRFTSCLICNAYIYLIPNPKLEDLSIFGFSICRE